MTGKELLKKMARFYQKDPAAWTQGWFARTASGHKVLSLNEEAVCWCVAGLSTKLADSSQIQYEALGLLQKKVGGSIVKWNDSRSSVNEVIEMLEKAAA